jgi:hypothetical protein
MQIQGRRIVSAWGVQQSVARQLLTEIGRWRHFHDGKFL